ncbi:MAG: N-acetyltransferase family protein [Reyranellaceae bacterium]
MRPLLRDVVEADIAQIQSIYSHHVLHGAASFEEVPPDLAEMSARFAALKARNMPYVAAVEDGRILGYAYAGPYRPRSAYRFTVEDSIYLAPDAAGRGLGRTLLAEIIARSTALGMRQMIAVIGDSANVASIGLHRALGFEMIGTFPAIGFKFGRWIDSVLMQRALGDGQATLPE